MEELLAAIGGGDVDSWLLSPPRHLGWRQGCGTVLGVTGMEAPILAFWDLRELFRGPGPPSRGPHPPFRGPLVSLFRGCVSASYSEVEMPKVRQRGRAPAPQDGQREVRIFLVRSLKVGRPAALPVQGTPLGGLSIRTRVRVGIRSTWEAETQRRAALVQGPLRRESLSTRPCTPPRILGCRVPKDLARRLSPLGAFPLRPSLCRRSLSLSVFPPRSLALRPAPCALGMAAQLQAPRSRFWRGVAPGMIETSACRVRPLHVPSSLLAVLLPGQVAASL